MTTCLARRQHGKRRAAVARMLGRKPYGRSAGFLWAPCTVVAAVCVLVGAQLEAGMAAGKRTSIVCCVLTSCLGLASGVVQEPNACRMSYSYPSYEPVDVANLTYVVACCDCGFLSGPLTWHALPLQHSHLVHVACLSRGGRTRCERRDAARLCA